MAAIPQGARSSLARATVAFTIMLACLPARADPEAATGEQGYVRFAMVVPEMDFRLDYHGRKADGTVKTKFLDESTSNGEGPVPWLSAGVRVRGPYWVGGDFLSFSGEGKGKVGKRVYLGPFSFFVNAPTTDTYTFDIGRAWVGYRAQESESGSLMALGGVTVVRARAKATIPGLVQESVDGVLALPMLGIRYSRTGPYLTRWLLEADYAYVGYDDMYGQAANFSLSVEKPLANGFSVGVGYKYYKLMANADRTKYDAQVDQKLTGPFFFANYVF